MFDQNRRCRVTQFTDTGTQRVGLSFALHVIHMLTLPYESVCGEHPKSIRTKSNVIISDLVTRWRQANEVTLAYSRLAETFCLTSMIINRRNTQDRSVYVCSFEF